MIEPIDLTYDVHLLPVDRIPFRRWRWELWHGSRMIAAGWRLSVLHAQRAVRSHALRHAHRLHGLHPLRTDAPGEPERTWGEHPVVIDWGELRVVLTPRALLEARGELAPSASAG